MSFSLPKLQTPTLFIYGTITLIYFIYSNYGVSCNRFVFIHSYSLFSSIQESNYCDLIAGEAIATSAFDRQQNDRLAEWSGHAESGALRPLRASDAIDPAAAALAARSRELIARELSTRLHTLRL